jgi:hypothetical protein
MKTISEEILIEFATTPEATVAQFAARYPGSERIIAALATDSWVGADSSSPLIISTDTAVKNIGLSVLAARKSAMTFTLSQLAQQKGLDAAGAASALRLPIALFWKLQRRLITFETLPTDLANRLADVLGKSADEMKAYLRMPPQLAAGASFKAEEMPEVSQESFGDALQADGTPEELKAWGLN